MFAVRNVPGSLHRSLGAFASRGLNLSRLESRPWTARGSRWEYLFWVDLDADPADPECAAALAELGSETEVVRILGTYAAGRGGLTRRASVSRAAARAAAGAGAR